MGRRHGGCWWAVVGEKQVVTYQRKKNIAISYRNKRRMKRKTYGVLSNAAMFIEYVKRV
jgi:hypothetical protein